MPWKTAIRDAGRGSYKGLSFSSDDHRIQNSHGADIQIDPDPVRHQQLRKFVLQVGPIISVFDYVIFVPMFVVFHAWNNPALFQTGWFVESLLTGNLRRAIERSCSRHRPAA